MCEKGRGVVLALVAMTFAGADWPQFLGPNRDAHSAEKGLATSWPKGGPPVVWEREVGAGYAGPVVADGKLILFQRVGGEEVIECLQASTGKPVWKQAYRCGYRDSYGKGDGPLDACDLRQKSLHPRRRRPAELCELRRRRQCLAS